MLPTADAIDALLPQTQCTRCGFAACRPYAEAIAAGTADIDRCPPGGPEGIERLARLLGTAPKPLDASCGDGRFEPPAAAVIDESACIGCTLCIQACPVDAIVGAPKRMHTVLLEACTGCRLCLPPCPVDCIRIETVGALQEQGHSVSLRPPSHWRERADLWRTRYHTRQQRRVREEREREERLARKAGNKLAAVTGEDAEARRKRAVIEAAMARARQRRESRGDPP